jgi:hypothetical protein
MPALPGFVFSFVFNRLYGAAGFFPGVAFISHGATEKYFLFKVAGQGVQFFSLRALVSLCDKMLRQRLRLSGLARSFTRQSAGLVLGLILAYFFCS